MPVSVMCLGLHYCCNFFLGPNSQNVEKIKVVASCLHIGGFYKTCHLNCHL